jgi:hypothetical protein
MKQPKSALLLVSILIMGAIWGFAALYHAGYIPTGLDLFIFLMIVVGGIYAFVTHMRRHKDIEAGLAVDDEMSNLVKYKAGYYAFMASLYMWLGIFMFHRFFPDTETMLGGGILASCILAMAMRTYLGRTAP